MKATYALADLVVTAAEEFGISRRVGVLTCDKNGSFTYSHAPSLFVEDISRREAVALVKSMIARREAN